MAAADNSLALPAGEGRKIALGPNLLTFKAVGADTGGAYAAIELTTEPGTGSSLHTHYNEDEAFFVLQGTLTIYLGERVVTATPGSFILIPKGLTHAFVNRGAETARSLIIVSPAGLEGFFETLAGPATPQDAEGFAALAKKYNIEFGGPPPEPPQNAIP